MFRDTDAHRLPRRHGRRGVEGQSVLVAGGPGAVGHYAVQLAKLKGARQVIATVSSPAKVEFARAAGADLVVNYREEDFAARCREATGGRGLDRIIEVDFAANVGADFEALRHEGEVVVYGSGDPEVAVPFLPAILKNVRLRFFIVYHLTPEDRALNPAALPLRVDVHDAVPDEGGVVGLLIELADERSDRQLGAVKDDVEVPQPIATVGVGEGLAPFA